MTPEFDFFGLYFSSIVPRFLICLALWIPLHWLIATLNLTRWIFYPPLFHLSLFIILLAVITFYWHP